MVELLRDADQDTEARHALWRAIGVASDDVRHRFQVRSIVGLDSAPAGGNSPVPPVATWQLVEALSLLAILLRSEDALADIINLFGKTGPIGMREDSTVRWLWAQQTLRGERSGLNGRPDLLVTSTREQPHPGNAVRIIEAKALRNLGTQTVRGEFGKAHDLRVATYLIWSFYTPAPKVIAGARGLGIDLEALGFDTPHRPDLIASPDALISRVAYAQEEARRARRFAGALEAAGEEARLKLRAPQ